MRVCEDSLGEDFLNSEQEFRCRGAWILLTSFHNDCFVSGLSMQFFPTNPATCVFEGARLILVSFAT